MYDASAKTKKSNLNLNECLYHGHVIVYPVDEILITQSCVSCCIEKAFLQAGLQEKGMNVTRFLWLKDITKPVKTENTAVIKFTRIPFGVTSSQFILAATIIHHLIRKGQLFQWKSKRIFMLKIWLLAEIQKNQHCKFI